MDVSSLHQEGPLIIISDSGTPSSPMNSEKTDPGYGLEGSDLSDYIRTRAEIVDIDAAFQTIGNHGVLIPLSSSTDSSTVASSSCSYSIDSSATS